MYPTRHHHLQTENVFRNHYSSSLNTETVGNHVVGRNKEPPRIKAEELVNVAGRVVL